VARGRLRLTSDYRFRRGMIAGRWHAGCRKLCPGARVRAHFPTRGRIDAVLRDGSRVRLGAGAPRRRVRLADVRRVDLGGYRLERLNGPPGATLFAVPVRPEPTNPSPAASLAVQLSPGHRFHRLSLAAAIVPG
jgi:hypothetical protein